MTQRYKLVVFVPLSHAEVVREAIGMAGGGHMGAYSFCSFSSRGVGRFKPEAGAHPAIGTVGTLECVEEERIEVLVDEEHVKPVIEAMKRVHPYEEVAYDVYLMADF